jgi:hypothetical protein
MASSYTTSFGIEKIGSGEQSGAWGDTTNHNLDILDRIASYKAVGLSGTTHTLTVREASPGSGTENLQDGMYRVIKFTGALGANNTVTVAPNTTSAFFIIINATTDSGSSGPYSVILTQGSGANITVANGKSAVVYMDGAGSGAAVVNALSDLQIATLTASGNSVLASVDVTGVATAATFEPDGDTAAGDNAAIGYTAAEGLILTGQGSTSDITLKNDADGTVFTVPTGTDDILFPDSARAMFGAGSDLKIFHDGTHSHIDNDGAGALFIASNSMYITNSDRDENFILGADNGAVTLYFDSAAKLATNTGGVTITGAVSASTTVLAATDTDTSNTGSVTIDFAAHQNFVLTLTGNVTLANPSTESVGQAGVFVFIQDGTGSRTLSLGTDYESPAGGGITLSTAASAVDVVPYFVKASGSIQLGAPQLAFS